MLVAVVPADPSLVGIGIVTFVVFFVLMTTTMMDGVFTPGNSDTW